MIEKNCSLGENITETPGPVSVELLKPEQVEEIIKHFKLNMSYADPDGERLRLTLEHLCDYGKLGVISDGNSNILVQFFT